MKRGHDLGKKDVHVDNETFYMPNFKEIMSWEYTIIIKSLNCTFLSFIWVLFTSVLSWVFAFGHFRDKNLFDLKIKLYSVLFDFAWWLSKKIDSISFN